METKPYNLQSPEQIAKDYGGNKQKIAEAMQMGIVDPTAGTLAGMFIDRMRSAQTQEQAPQQTVAQQIFAPPAPPAPPQGDPSMQQQGAPPQGGMQPPMPPAPPAGLGATPEAAQMAEQMPPMQPPMPAMPPPMPEMPPQEAPMGMAGGGLTTLPLPDTMFDEPSNGGFDDGYAGGGIVAFARGGGALTDDEAWNRIKRIEGGLGPNGEMRVSSAGAVGPSQLMPATAPEAARLAGLPWDERRYRTDPAYNEALGKAYYLSRVAARKGDYNKAALDYHSGMGNVDKGKIGPEGREYARKFSGSELPDRNINTPEGQIASAEDIFGRLQERFGPSSQETESRKRMMARAEEMASDEGDKERRKSDMWQTLAEIGFNMASSKSPFLLQAVGEAAAAAMPGARADKKERKAIKDRGLSLMVELGASDRKEAQQLWGMAVDAAKTNMQQKQFGEKMALDERQVALAERKLQEEIRIAGLTKPEDINDRVTRYLLDFPEGTPQHEAARRVFEAKRPPSTTDDTAERLKQLREGRTGGGAPAVGTVQDGFRFKGGDPANAANWEKVG
jgi:hypothetical protein